MSTATKTRTTRSTRTTRKTPTRPQRTTRHTPQRGRSAAAQKAYARRAQRSKAVGHSRGVAASKGVLSMVKLRLPQSRASFVMLVMALLVAGVGMTMWLSTQAIADSYRLENMRAQTEQLSERADRLQREVVSGESAGALAKRAEDLGMMPSGHPARLVVDEGKKPKVIGTPTPAGTEDSEELGGADAG